MGTTTYEIAISTDGQDDVQYIPVTATDDNDAYAQYLAWKAENKPAPGVTIGLLVQRDGSRQYLDQAGSPQR